MIPGSGTPTPPNGCPKKVLTSYTLQFLRYSPDKILNVKVTIARSNVKSRSQHGIAQPQLPTNVPTKFQFLFSVYSLDEILHIKVTTTRSKVKSRSQHDTALLQLPTNVPTKYQLPMPYGFGDIAKASFKGQGHYSKL